MRLYVWRFAEKLDFCLLRAQSNVQRGSLIVKLLHLGSQLTVSVGSTTFSHWQQTNEK